MCSHETQDREQVVQLCCSMYLRVVSTNEIQALHLVNRTHHIAQYGLRLTEIRVLVQVLQLVAPVGAEHLNHKLRVDALK